jgi:2-dehydropantoate 2-reductase
MQKLPQIQHEQTTPWLVVGRGAIGLLAASRWALVHQPVQLWLRQVQHLNFRFSVGSRDYPMQLAAASHGPFTKVLIPVKAFDTVAAVQQLLPHLTENAQIVLCHNGMGTLEQVQPLLLPTQSLWCLQTISIASAAYRFWRNHARRL